MLTQCKDMAQISQKLIIAATILHCYILHADIQN